MLFSPATLAPVLRTGTDMNAIHFVLCAGLCTGLLTTALGSAPRPQEQKEKKRSGIPVARFFDDEGERLAKEVEGSWTLFEYTDPSDLALDDVASGFATFHDGFLSLILAMDTVEQRLFRAREFLALDTGVFRYRFDEQANLQLASVMSFTNQTDDGEMEREPPGRVVEYFTSLEDGVLELRDRDGVLFSFRKIAAGDFPEAAIRKLDRRRSDTEQWEDEDEERR